MINSVKKIISSRRFFIAAAGTIAAIAVIRYIYNQSLSHRDQEVLKCIRRFEQESQRDPWKFFNAFLLKPRQYLYWDLLGSVNFLGRDLYECACPGSRRHNRLWNRRRESTENRMIKDAKQLFATDEPLVYASMGSGGLLQDLINVGKLLRAGYGNLTVYLIDPKLPQNSLKAFRRFLNQAAKAKNASLNIRTFTTIKHCPKGFHILSTIDYDPFMDTFGDWLEAQERLANNGRHYFSRGAYEFTFNASSCVEKIAHDTENAEKAIQNLQLQSPTGTIRYAQLSNAFFLQKWAFFIPSIAQQAIDLSITYVTIKQCPEITKARLCKWLQLFVNCQITLKPVDSISDITQQNDHYDVISWLGFEKAYTNEELSNMLAQADEKRIIQRMQAIRQLSNTPHDWPKEKQEQQETIKWIEEHASTAYFLSGVIDAKGYFKDNVRRWSASEKAPGS